MEPALIEASAADLFDGLPARRAGIYRPESEAVLRARFVGPLIGLAKLARLGELSLTPAVPSASAEAVWAGLQRPRVLRGKREERA